MQGSGNKPPGMVHGKMIYIESDIDRLASYNQGKLSSSLV